MEWEINNYSFWIRHRSKKKLLSSGPRRTGITANRIPAPGGCVSQRKCTNIYNTTDQIVRCTTMHLWLLNALLTDERSCGNVNTIFMSTVTISSQIHVSQHIRRASEAAFGAHHRRTTETGFGTNWFPYIVAALTTPNRKHRLGADLQKIPAVCTNSSIVVWRQRACVSFPWHSNGPCADDRKHHCSIVDRVCVADFA
jgi:hypothetical protein